MIIQDAQASFVFVRNICGKGRGNLEYWIFLWDMSGERCDPKQVSRQLCAQAVNVYCASRGIKADFRSEDFLAEDKGKPYLEGYPVHFNVSHSGLLWLCMVGDAPCGIDIQQEKDLSFEKIAARHFNEREQAYIKREGLAGFFRVWTMREAYGKYTGQGFYGDMPAFIGEDGEPASNAGGAFIRRIEIGPGIHCAYCTGGETDEIRFIG